MKQEQRRNKMWLKQKGGTKKSEKKEKKKKEAVFCSTLPFSTLEHHWWHVQPLKLLANRLSPFAPSPSIIKVKGHCASQLMSQRASVPPSPLPELPQFSGRHRNEADRESHRSSTSTWASVRRWLCCSCCGRRATRSFKRFLVDK